MHPQIQQYVREVLAGMSPDDQQRIREACQRDALFLSRVLEVMASVASATKVEGTTLDIAAETHVEVHRAIEGALRVLTHHVQLWTMVQDPDRAQLYEVLKMNAAWPLDTDDEADGPGDLTT